MARMAIRISYFDVVGRALAAGGGPADLLPGGPGDPREVGRAIERLSATFREGRADFDRSAVGRAAYLWHLLPAHVCDLARLFLDVPGLLDDEARERVSLLGLGAGPGSEVLALLEAVTSLRARGGLPALREVRARRVDLSGEWDLAFPALLDAARRDLVRRDPELGTSWTLDAPARALVSDLAASPPDEAVVAAAAEADLVVAANLLTEVAPRGTDELPGGLAELLAGVVRALPAGAHLLLVDRQNAPGAAARLEAAAAVARDARPGATVEGPRERTTRCTCGLTRQVKALYEHVRLPLTKDEDRPVLNCRTLWWQIRT
jgi:hypothetical protein